MQAIESAPVERGQFAQPATMPLWPDAAHQLGVGRDLTYRLAARGDFPGAVRLGRLWLVLRAPFERALAEGWQPDERSAPGARESVAGGSARRRTHQ